MDLVNENLVSKIDYVKRQLSIKINSVSDQMTSIVSGIEKEGEVSHKEK